MKLAPLLIIPLLVLFSWSRPVGATTEITGTFVNPSGHCILVSSQADVYIHDAIIGPCDGDGIKVLNSTRVTIRNVTIRDSAASIAIFSSSYVLVDGADLAGTTHPKPEGQSVLLNASNHVTVQGVHTFADNTNQEDAINVYKSSTVTVQDSVIVGGFSPTGCGIVIDTDSQNVTVQRNTVSDQSNCGIGLASGTGHYVQNNTVMRTRQAYYANKFSGKKCGGTFRNNVTPDGGFWKGNCSILQYGNSWN